MEETDPIDESDVKPEQSESGLQNHEISNDECALCFGLYEDDFSSTGKLQREWVQCTRMTCKKWMYSDCLNQENNKYVCRLCKMIFVNYTFA